MKRDAIRVRILVPMMAALAILLGSFLVGTYREGKHRNHEELEQQVDRVERLFAAYLEKDANMMSAALSSLETDVPLRTAFQQRDRQTLLEHATPLFQRLNSEHRATHFYFTDVDRVNLLRIHQPERHGDSIDRSTTLTAERTGKPAWGIELGPLGTFTVRVVHPWYDDQQRLIGYIELGEEIDHIIDGLCDSLNVEMYPIVFKKFLDRQSWEDGMRMLGRAGDWGTMEDCVIVGRRPIPDGLIELHEDRCEGDRRFDYHLDTQHRKTRVAFLPLLDVMGRTVGDLGIQQDVTERYNAGARKMLTAIMVCVLVGGLLFALFFVHLGRIERDLASARQKAAEESRTREEAQTKLTEEIRAHRDRLQIVVDGIPSPLMVIDCDYRIQLANRAARESIGGIDPTQHGLTCYHVSHHRDTPCEGPDDPCPLTQAIREKVVVKVSHVHYDADGAAHAIDIIATPVFNEQGEVCQVIESCYEVTDRVQALESLRLQGSALEAAANAIVITDREGRITWVNPAFTRLTGFPLEEAVGRTPRILKSGEQDDAFYEDLWATILAGKVWHGEMVDRRRDGVQFTGESTITPVPNETGQIDHFVAILQDITERKRAEAELEDAKLTAELASRSKSDFLANMSHEIRTPMTAILGFAGTLLDAAQTEGDRVQAIETIRRNGENLLSIINDILDLSKVEAGRMTLEQIPYSPLELLAEVQSLLQERAAEKGLELKVECVGKVPEMIQTDPTRLRQVLVNLVGNAVKFTESGSVRLVARFFDEEEATVQFDVVDSGIGMTEEQAEVVFRPFNQADGSTARQFGGTGLGLTLSRHFAELLGGTLLLADTQPGIGSRFQLTIPVQLAENTPIVDSPKVPIHPGRLMPQQATEKTETLDARILLAEDGIDNQRIISIILKKANAEVDVVENGQLAVDAALTADREGRPYDVILMDMQMPVMDGYEATARLRQEGYAWPIVAVTANAMVGDRRKCLEIGCDDYVSKPIDCDGLGETIRRCLATTAAVTARPTE